MKSVYKAVIGSVLVLATTGFAAAQSWPEGARDISRGDFRERSGEVWVCELFSGHSTFNDLGRQYYFENMTPEGGTLHSVTKDQGTLISQGYKVRGFNKSAAYLRREYVYDDGVRFPEFEGDSVSIPMKVGADGNLYPGTFKDIDNEFQVGILKCTYDSDGKPDWAY